MDEEIKEIEKEVEVVETEQEFFFVAYRHKGSDKIYLSNGFATRHEALASEDWINGVRKKVIKIKLATYEV